MRRGRQIRAETLVAGCASIGAGVARLLGRLRGAAATDNPVPPGWTEVRHRAPRV